MEASSRGQWGCEREGGALGRDSYVLLECTVLTGKQRHGGRGKEGGAPHRLKRGDLLDKN
jgi:hypothetical protein